MSRTRVHNMNISLDGYAAGEHVTFDAPIGGAERLFKWFDGRVIHGVDKADAPVTLDRALTSMWSQGIGAEIMGRRKFGPQAGDWPDDGWRGWWGDEPPFQTPVLPWVRHNSAGLEAGYHVWPGRRAVARRGGVSLGFGLIRGCQAGSSSMICFGGAMASLASRSRCGLVSSVRCRKVPAGPVKVPTCRRSRWRRMLFQVSPAVVSMIRMSSSASQHKMTWARMRSSSRW